MRIIHTADWHLGRTLEGRSRIGEQEQFIAELCNLARDTNAGLIVVAGDVFDTANPPAAAEELFYAALDELSAGGQRAVLVIAGNHDNPDRLCAAAPLACRQGVVLLGRPGDIPGTCVNDTRETTPTTNSAAKKLQGQLQLTSFLAPERVTVVQTAPGWCEFTCGAERVQVAAVPYPSEARLDEALVEGIEDEVEMRQAYTNRVQQVFAQSAAHFSLTAIRLAVSHLYAAGGVESDSERPIQVGGAFTVHPQAFPAQAQYVALGHLHRPQNLPQSDIRYSGSPLAYSFAEAGQAKSVTLLEADPQQVRWQEVHLSAGKPLVRWRAPYGLGQVEQWCTDGRDSNAWVELEIHLDVPLTPEEVAKLKRLHRGLVIIRPVFAAQAQVAAAAEDRQGLPVDELFRLFYASRREGAAPAPETLRLFLELLEQAAGGHEPGSSHE